MLGPGLQQIAHGAKENTRSYGVGEVLGMRQAEIAARRNLQRLDRQLANVRAELASLVSTHFPEPHIA